MTHFRDAVKELLWIKNRHGRVLARIWTFSPTTAIAVRNIVFRHLPRPRNYRNFEVSMKRYLFDSCVAMWEIFTFFPPLLTSSREREGKLSVPAVWRIYGSMSAKRKTLIEFISSSPIFLSLFFFSGSFPSRNFLKIIGFFFPHSFARSAVSNDINFMKSF